jgi:rhodanese-related sulfurtransferase
VPHLASYPVSDFQALAAAVREQPVAVLDVRRRLEWSAGHIEGALHVPLHQLPGRPAIIHSVSRADRDPSIPAMRYTAAC